MLVSNLSYKTDNTLFGLVTCESLQLYPTGRIELFNGLKYPQQSQAYQVINVVVSQSIYEVTLNYVFSEGKAAVL